MEDMKWNQRLARWLVRDVLKVPECAEVFGLARCIIAILQPVRYIVHMHNKKEGYNLFRDIWNIEGLQFSGELMRHFGYGSDELFRIIERGDGVITIQKVEDLCASESV